MSDYEEEIFKYLTSKDNFASAYQIYEQFPEVKDKLIEQFWLEVEKSLRELAKNTKWEVEFEGNILKKDWYLNIYDHVSFQISFGEMDGKNWYGLYIDEDDNALDHNKIKKYLIDKLDPTSLSWVKRDTYWQEAIETGEDFTTLNTLKKTLPENRKEFSEEMAKVLFEYGEGWKSCIIKMSKMISK